MNAIDDSYHHLRNDKELCHIYCDRIKFAELARAHHWRESVIAILVREPFGGTFQMGAYLVKLVR